MKKFLIIIITMILIAMNITVYSTAFKQINGNKSNLAAINSVQYNLCTSINKLNRVIKGALEEAKNRAKSSLPPNSPKLKRALRVLDHQINQLSVTNCNKVKS